MNVITVSGLKGMILEAGKQIESNEQWLSDLDAAIGDGDHGVSMTRGVRALFEKLNRSEYVDLGVLLTDSGKVLMKEVGGTCGPLLATLYLKMGLRVAGKSEADLSVWSAMLSDGLNGMKALGKAELGDKTMIDALEPAVRYVESCVESGETLSNALTGAASAAEEGAQHTVELVARKGRGRYQGDASIGHRDAGATSVALMFKGFSEAFIKQ